MNSYATDKVPIRNLGSFTKMMCLLVMSFFLLSLSQDTFAQGGPGCPTVFIDADNLNFPTQVCVGSPLEICLDTDGMGDLSQIQVSGIVVAGGPDPGFTITPAGDQICINTIPLSGDDPCAPYNLEITLGGANIITTDPACATGFIGINATNVPIIGSYTDPDINTALPLLAFAGADPIIVTIYPTYDIVVVNPACADEAGSATLQADGTDCGDSITGTVGVENICPATEDTDGALSYDFSAAVDPLACVNGELVGDIMIDCAIACPTCPVATEEPVLAGDYCYANGLFEPLVFCYTFDIDPATVNLTINGFVASPVGPNTLCVGVAIAPPGCEMTTVELVVEADCEGEPVQGITTGVAGSVNIYPDPADFVIDVQPSAGCGEAPIITDSTCPSLTAQGYAGEDPVAGCPPTTTAYEWTHTPPTFPNAPCQYPDQSGSEDITGCDTCGACPTAITAISFPGEVCAPDALEVCLDFDAAVTATTTVVINGVAGDGSAGGNQICVNLVTDNQTCDPLPLGLDIVADCERNAISIDIAWLDPQIYPETFDIDVIGPECDGDAGSATVLAVNGDVCDGPTAGQAGITAECPETVGTPATLAYNFGPYFEGTACEQAGFSDDISIACDAVCEECPVAAIPFFNVENCSGVDLEMCLDFETTVDATIVATIFGQVIDGSAGGTQICATTTVTNETCDVIDLGIDATATCNGEPIQIIIPFAPPLVYPAPFTLDVIQPECDGDGGSATVLAVNGDICDTATGTAGTTAICPETVGTPATLSYSFGPYFDSSPCEQAAFSDDISIACDTTCGDCDVEAPEITITPAEDCGDGTVVGPFTITSTGGSGGDIYYGVADPNDPNDPGLITVVSQQTSDIETEVNTNFLTNTFCIINITIVPEDLEAFITAFNTICDDPVFAPLCPQFGLPLNPATTTLTDIFNLNQSLGGAVTANFIEQLINFGAGGPLDVGVLFGLPPGVLIIELPPVCYVRGEDVCVTPVEECSEDCTITDVVVADITCQDNDTPNDPNDDLYTFTLTVTGVNTGAGWTATDPNGTTGTYAVPASFGPFPISNGTLSFTITDDTDPDCTFDVVVDPPAPCSDGEPTCQASAGIVEVPETICSGEEIDPLTAPVDASVNTGTLGYTFAITDANGFVIDVSDDGTGSGIDQLEIGGQVCFVGIVYIQEELDGIVQAAIALGLPVPPGAGLPELYDLAVALGLITPGSTTVADIITLIETQLPGLLGVPVPCLATSEPVCTTIINCTDVCIIENAVIADVACDDNGTSEDPADDTFTFTITVTGTNTGTGWTANDPNATTGAYGSAVSFGPYSIASGTLSFTITDDTDPDCTFDVQVDPPAPCSTPTGGCDEVAGEITLTPATDCGGGIGVGPYTIDASGAANGITVYIVGDPTVGDIDADGIADTAIVQLTSNINDITVNDTLCITPFTYDEDDFAAFIVAVNDLCNTPPFDQLCGAIGLPFPTNTTLEDVFGLLGGLAQLTVSDVLELINYGQGGQIDLGGILGLPLPVIIDIPTICYDLGEPVCVTPVDECPTECIITSANIATVACSDNGTDTDPSDDTFTFDLIVSGTNFGSGWTANDPNATSGSYNLVTNFGPFPISAGTLTFTITDASDPNCTFEVVVNPPETCSAGGTGCNLIAGTVDITGSSVCTDGTEIGPFSVNFTPGVGNGVDQLTLTDGAGNIITVVNSAAEAQDSINNAFGTICVTPFIYDQEDLDSLIVTINDAVVGIGGPPVLSAGSTIGDLLAALNGLLGVGGGAVPLTIADLDALLNGGAGGSTDIGAILGLPAGLLVIDLPPLCYTIGETICIDPVDSCPCNANNGVFPFKGN